MRPTKQVHFASTNVLYTFIALTPESTPIFTAKKPLTREAYDSYSPTKPTREKPRKTTVAKGLNDHNDEKRSHIRRLSLDSQLDEQRPVFLHFLLALSSDPYIKYDVSLPPETLVCRFPSSILAEPATSPPLAILAIDSPNCPWPITVIPSSSPATHMSHGVGAVVTVWDVLSALHYALRPAVTLGEYHALPSLDAIKKVNAAYAKRCKRVNSLEARMEEGLKGVRRVDFLGGMNHFVGLTVHPSASHVWKLVVSA